ncbi:MAG: DUF6468 domain-containing protein [Pseudomonadota bacterium]
MSIVTDGLLIVTCLTAALYCIVLSRRLAKFSDTKSGIGEQIAQLNSILEETRSTIRESQTGAKSVTERLARDIASSKKLSTDLADLIARAEQVLSKAGEIKEIETKVSAPRQRPPETPKIPEVIESPVITDANTPVEEEEFSEAAEPDFDLSDARGEPQLGFLPNVVEDAPDPEIDTGPDEDAKDDADQVEEAEPEDDEANQENLLKVERMAL